MKNIKINIETRIEDIKVIQEINRETEGVLENMVRIVYDTREEQLRQALIKLGWTPPKIE